MEIQTLVESLHWTGIEIKTINSAESWSKGITVVVSGSVKSDCFNGWREFVHTFSLAPQQKDKTYMVMNDIFHFVTKKDSSAAKRPLETFANWHKDPKDTTGVKIEADSFEPWMNQTIYFPGIRESDCHDGPVVITATIAGHFIQRIYFAEGSELEIMYEHCFLQLDENIRRNLIDDPRPLVGALGEVVRPLGRIKLPVIIGDGGRFRKLEMTFLVIRSPRSSPNVIIGRSGLCALRAVISINHGAIKFPTPSGIATIVSPSDDERIHQAA
ncbi:hypothetical protein M8C21_005190 [Ambrosia artemisiifolia]|uniref:NTF2 domain-containing protein n=1 Tax=Ambrosia artemisiifolia TaxID=4212 RepID=A0AAD5GD01_AMBAR|nr:hypothetical protein M8C21_005190 [Ambrosia artemisiifolia]